ncbi:MAG TPA: ParB N-terminal domain-containing protein, partial [Spirochaetia bacterium]
MTAADLLGKLSLEAAEKITGTPLEHDLDKLEQLVRVVPDEQVAVVRRHVIFEIPWEAAFEGLTLRSPDPTEDAKPAEVVDEPAPALEAAGVEPPARATAEPAERPEPVPAGTKQIESWRMGKLKPNKFNATLFPDSLSESSIALMVDDLAKSGQRVAVEITPDGTIVDGERRWRGARHLGWQEIDVIVGPELTDDEILDRVIDACTSARQMTVREQVNVFTAVTEQLRREAGRQAHRPRKVMPEGITYLTPRSIQEAAAKRAGFRSAKQAVRAEAVFTRGTPEDQAAVLDGSLTVTAAYEALPKRSKKKKAASTP